MGKQTKITQIPKYRQLPSKKLISLSRQNLSYILKISLSQHCITISIFNTLSHTVYNCYLLFTKKLRVKPHKTLTSIHLMLNIYIFYASVRKRNESKQLTRTYQIERL